MLCLFLFLVWNPVRTESCQFTAGDSSAVCSANEAADLPSAPFRDQIEALLIRADTSDRCFGPTAPDQPINSVLPALATIAIRGPFQDYARQCFCHFQLQPPLYEQIGCGDFLPDRATSGKFLRSTTKARTDNDIVELSTVGSSTKSPNEFNFKIEADDKAADVQVDPDLPSQSELVEKEQVLSSKSTENETNEQPKVEVNSTTELSDELKDESLIQANDHLLSPEQELSGQEHVGNPEIEGSGIGPETPTKDIKNREESIKEGLKTGNTYESEGSGMNELYPLIEDPFPPGPEMRIPNGESGKKETQELAAQGNEPGEPNSSLESLSEDILDEAFADENGTSEMNYTENHDGHKENPRNATEEENESGEQKTGHHGGPNRKYEGREKMRLIEGASRFNKQAEKEGGKNRLLQQNRSPKSRLLSVLDEFKNIIESYEEKIEAFCQQIQGVCGHALENV